MNILKMDYEESSKLFDTHKESLKKGFCYNNIFDLFQEARENNWKIGYGYFGNANSCFIRHCFFVDSDNNVIDPSIFFVFEDLEIKQYYLEYVPFALLNLDDYLDKLKKNKLEPNLSKVLKKEEERVCKWFVENQLPVELNDYQYLRPYDKERKIYTVSIN